MEDLEPTKQPKPPPSYSAGLAEAIEALNTLQKYASALMGELPALRTAVVVAETHSTPDIADSLGQELMTRVAARVHNLEETARALRERLLRGRFQSPR